MPTVTSILRKRLLSDVPDRMPPLEVLRRTERSAEFEEFRMNRKIFGAMRYGRLGAKGKPKYDRVGDMIRRLEAFKIDGNAEHLIDVANLAELEFVEGDRIIMATDDGEHTKETA